MHGSLSIYQKSSKACFSENRKLREKVVFTIGLVRGYEEKLHKYIVTLTDNKNLNKLKVFIIGEKVLKNKRTIIINS